MCTKTSGRVYHIEIRDNNFDQDSPSEVTEDFDCSMCASATEFLENITSREIPNSNSYLPPEDCNLLTPDAKKNYGGNYLRT